MNTKNIAVKYTEKLLATENNRKTLNKKNLQKTQPEKNRGIETRKSGKHSEIKERKKLQQQKQYEEQIY